MENLISIFSLMNFALRSEVRTGGSQYLKKQQMHFLFFFAILTPNLPFIRRKIHKNIKMLIFGNSTEGFMVIEHDFSEFFLLLTNCDTN